MWGEGVGVGDEAVLEGSASDVGVFGDTLPGFDGGVLEGASEGEGDGPGEGTVVDDGLEIGGGLFGGLAAAEEDDAGEIRWDVLFEGGGGGSADVFWR